MNSNIQTQWSQIIQWLMDETNLSSPVIRTFIEPLEIVSHQDHFLILQADKDKIGDSINLIRNKYDAILRVAIETITGESVEIEYEYKAKKEPEFQEKSAESKDFTSFYSDNSFENFVQTSTNQFAFTASLAVAESPSQSYNPLFIYSSPGLGKTHLLHSIARSIREHYPDLNVLYIPSEVFVNQLVDALRRNKESGGNSAINNFRKKYRNVDVLLIDDIQFIIGKDSSQMEFFFTYEALLNDGKQIVLSSDKPPRDLENLDERYISRFNSSLSVSIDPPDYETSLAFLKNYRDKANIKLEDDILNYIASNIRTNIRELIGAYTKVTIGVQLTHEESNLEMAKAALQDMITPNVSKVITLNNIIQIVCEHYDISKEDIVGKKRMKSISMPRQVIMYLAREYTNLSTTAIGNSLGNRDHTTIIHGYEQIKNAIPEDEKLEHDLDIIKKQLLP